MNQTELHNGLSEKAHIWHENNAVFMKGQNNEWRTVLPLGDCKYINKGTIWTDFPDEEDTFSFLHRGLVRLSSLGENGIERIVLYIGEGCIFRELSSTAPHNIATFFAMEHCEIYNFPRRILQDMDFALKHPLLMMNLVQSLMQKAGAFFSQIDEKATLSPEIIICRYLLRMTEDPLLPRPHFSQSDLARSLGLHRSTVCRVLHSLRERNILGDFTKKSLEILDKKALEDLCRFPEHDLQGVAK